MKKPITMVNRVSAESVKKYTKKNWDQWVEILNKAGAQNFKHQETVALLKKKYKLTTWWCQGVAMGYEIVIGKRVEGRNLKGEYTVTATKTIAVDAKKIWKFVSSTEGMAIWLNPLSEIKLKPKQTFEADGGVFGEIRTIKAGRNIRLRWQDSEWDKPSIVQLGIVPRPKGKSIVYIMHENLKDGRLKNPLRAHWKKVLSELADRLAS